MPEFNRDATRRVSRAVRSLEMNPIRREAPKATPPNTYWGAKFAITTSVITAHSGSALGKGTAKLQLLSRDTSNNATYAATSYPDVIVYNCGTSILSGVLIQIKVIDGMWVIDWVAC